MVVELSGAFDRSIHEILTPLGKGLLHLIWLSVQVVAAEGEER